MQELVSIIVPVYKVESYLLRCVDSLQKQTYKNIEIILVDDGSPDGCGKLCDSYAKEDNRIQVIHKANVDLSDARNIAISRATGQYITFVNSNDWVAEFYVEHLYEAIQKDSSDLACSWFENVYEGQCDSLNSSKAMIDYRCLSSQDCLKKMFYQDGVECCAWGKLYRKNIFSYLQYPVGKLYVDIPVTYECMKQSKKIAIISNADYYYLQRNTNIQYQSFNPRKLDGVDHCRKMMEAVKKDFPDLYLAAECRYLSTVCNILFQIPNGQYTKERENLWLEVEKYRKDVLRDREAKKKTRMAALLSYCGYSIMSDAYKMTQARRGDSEKDLPLISVIIPVYKVEKYLRQCVDSVINQTYDCLEIILIDDGSPDNSGSICDEYALTDMRIKTFHIPNGGVSCARNYGLDNASGDYIFFLDSDDYIEPDCLVILLAFLYAEGVDCAVCGANRINEDSLLKPANYDETILQACNYTQDDAIASLCYMQKPFPGIDMGAIWGCLFHRNVIQNERFDTIISIGEDFEFWFRVLLKADRITYLNVRLYNYRIISSSVMHNGFDDKKYESVMRLAEIATLQHEKNIEFLSRTINIALVVLLMIPEDETYNAYRYKIEKYIRSKRRIVLRNMKCRNKVRMALILSYFGFPFMKSAFHIAKKE